MSENQPTHLIPWQVKAEHRWAYPLAMLRLEARRRRGETLVGTDEGKLNAFTLRLQVDGLVVHYDPGTPEGFHFVPARDVDTDLIRVPENPPIQGRPC